MFLKGGRKKEASKVKQTNKAKQHSTPKAVTFPRKNELAQVGLEPTTLYTPDGALYQLSYRGSSAGWAQISHLIVHMYVHGASSVIELTSYYMYVAPYIRYTCSYSTLGTCILAGAYEPLKAQGASNYVEQRFHLRAFSAFRIRTILDYGEYPQW